MRSLRWIWLIPLLGVVPAWASCNAITGAEPGVVESTQGPDGGAGDPCVAYCDEVTANCTDKNIVYASTAVCLAACSELPLIAAGASKNSIACRAQQAKFAGTTGEPAISCPAAGPGGGSALPDGGSVCGSNCDGYCTLMLANCSQTFADMTECMTACAQVPDIGGFNASIQSGNSIQCRLYHVCAATQDPTTHCPHASGLALCIP